MRSALPLPTLVVCALIRPTPAVAQETPTERTAAADVIRRVNDLERSLALPQLVARLTGKDPRRDAVVTRARELMERELLAMADDITRHPEVGHKEERSVKILTNYLKAHDIIVEMGLAGLATAFVARYRNGTPGPNLGVILEYDVVHYTFSGAPAHQLQAWDRRDALMGVIELFNHIDGLRKTLRPETKIQGIITEGGKAPNVVPDRAAAEFWFRYPDPVYLAQVLERVNDAARGAALATGTKVHIDIDSSSRNGISVAALNDVAFAYMKKFGATKVQDEPGRPISFEETGTVATQIPGVGVTAHSSNGGYHTFEMEADALGEVGHHGFLVDAQTMTAVLYHLATDAPYRAAVQREFDGLKGLYSEYLAALRSAYPLPTVPEPTGN